MFIEVIPPKHPFYLPVLNENKTVITPYDYHPCERKQSLPAQCSFTFVYSKVLFLCQVSRADILAQFWQYRQRRQGVMGHRPAISQQLWHASHRRMMNGYTCMPHICSCTHMTHIDARSHTGTCAETYRQPSWSGQPVFGIAHTQLHKDRQTSVLQRCIIQSQVQEERGIRLCLLAAPLVFSKLPCLLGTSTQTDAVLCSG